MLMALLSSSSYSSSLFYCFFSVFLFSPNIIQAIQQTEASKHTIFRIYFFLFLFSFQDQLMKPHYIAFILLSLEWFFLFFVYSSPTDKKTRKMFIHKWKTGILNTKNVFEILWTECCGDNIEEQKNRFLFILFLRNSNVKQPLIQYLWCEIEWKRKRKIL